MTCINTSFMRKQGRLLEAQGHSVRCSPVHTGSTILKLEKCYFKDFTACWESNYNLIIYVIFLLQEPFGKNEPPHLVCLQFNNTISSTELHLKGNTVNIEFSTVVASNNSFSAIFLLYRGLFHEEAFMCLEVKFAKDFIHCVVSDHTSFFFSWLKCARSSGLGSL